MIMRATIYILSLLVITGWAVVYFKYHEGGYFHLTLAVAVIAISIQWLPDIKLLDKLKDRTHESRKKFKER
jgi:hypothetical protein